MNSLKSLTFSVAVLFALFCATAEAKQTTLLGEDHGPYGAMLRKELGCKPAWLADVLERSKITSENLHSLKEGYPIFAADNCATDDPPADVVEKTRQIFREENTRKLALDISVSRPVAANTPAPSAQKLPAANVESTANSNAAAAALVKLQSEYKDLQEDYAASQERATQYEQTASNLNTQLENANTQLHMAKTGLERKSIQLNVAKGDLKKARAAAKSAAADAKEARGAKHGSGAYNGWIGFGTGLLTTSLIFFPILRRYKRAAKAERDLAYAMINQSNQHRESVERIWLQVGQARRDIHVQKKEHEKDLEAVCQRIENFERVVTIEGNIVTLHLVEGQETRAAIKQKGRLVFFAIEQASCNESGCGDQRLKLTRNDLETHAEKHRRLSAIPTGQKNRVA
jgi:hypothetical protein